MKLSDRSRRNGQRIALYSAGECGVEPTEPVGDAAARLRGRRPDPWHDMISRGFDGWNYKLPGYLAS